MNEKNPYLCGPQICPKCGKRTYLYGHSYSDGGVKFAYHWFYCTACNYENNKETWPELQSLQGKVN